MASVLLYDLKLFYMRKPKRLRRQGVRERGKGRLENVRYHFAIWFIFVDKCENSREGKVGKEKE